MEFIRASAALTGMGALCILVISACGSTQSDGVSGSSDLPATGTPKWREAFDASEAGFLSAVWGSAPDDVFIVGGQPDRGVVYHFDGQSWSPMAIPDVPILIWVFGFGPDDLFAVGEQGGAIHYDGATWQRMQTGTSIDLWGVWGASSTEVWAVGGEIAEDPPIILRFDGRGWTSQELPALDRPATALLKVWGTSRAQVFAVGQLGIILEYDGSSWQQVPSGTARDLISLWGTGPDRIVAVGGRSNGVVDTYDGSTWTSQSAAPLPGLNGVFMEYPAEAVVVGLLGSAAVLDPETSEFVLEDTPTALTLHAIWGDGAGTMYAVGGRTTEQPYLGVALVRSIGGPDLDPTTPGPAACQTDDDCSLGMTCALGLCSVTSVASCESDNDCLLGQVCNGGLCGFSSVTQMELGILNGQPYRVVESGGEMPLFRGFQGVSHIFATLHVRAIPADIDVQLTWTVTQVSNGTVRSHFSVPAILHETDDSSILELADQFIVFDTLADTLDGLEVELDFVLTAAADGSVMGTLTQTVVLKLSAE